MWPEGYLNDSLTLFRHTWSMSDTFNQALLRNAVGIGISRTDAIGTRAIVEIILPCGVTRATALNIGDSIHSILREKGVSQDYDIRNMDDQHKGMDTIGKLVFYTDVPAGADAKTIQKELEASVAKESGVAIRRFAPDTDLDAVHNALRNDVLKSQDSCPTSSLSPKAKFAEKDATPPVGRG